MSLRGNNSYLMYIIYTPLADTGGEKVSWMAVTTQGPPPIPCSLHSAVIIKSNLFVFGGWVPVLSEDGALPTQETEWKCSNKLARLNLGERL